MKLRFAFAGVLVVGLTGSALAIGASEKYYIAHDMEAKKCNVLKVPTTGEAGAGEVFESEAAAKAAMDKMPDCAAAK